MPSKLNTTLAVGLASAALVAWIGWPRSGKPDAQEPDAPAAASAKAARPTPFEQLPSHIGRVGTKTLGKERVRTVLEGFQAPETVDAERFVAEVAWETALAEVQHEVVMLEVRRRNMSLTDNEREEIALSTERRATLKKLVEPVGLTTAEVMRGREEMLLVRRLMTEEIYDKVDVSDAEVAAEYARDPSAHRTPGSYMVRRIVIAVDGDGPEALQTAHKVALDVRQQARSGRAKFGALARKYSSASDRHRGGLIPEFTSAKFPRKRPRFVSALLRLKTGGVSRPYQMAEGLEILYLEKRIPDRPMTLAEATPTIRRLLQYRNGSVLALNWVTSMVEEAGAEVLVPKPEWLN